MPSVLHGSQPSSILEGQVHHHLVQEEHLGPTVAEREGEGLQPGDHLRWASRTEIPFKAMRSFLSLIRCGGDQARGDPFSVSCSSTTLEETEAARLVYLVQPLSTDSSGAP